MASLRGGEWAARGGEWAAVKTLAVGVVHEPQVNRRGEAEIHTADLSYFSRLADHAPLGRLALVETPRRGTETAGVVCAVVDGAGFPRRGRGEQGFIDLHRPDAVRILDWGATRSRICSCWVRAAFPRGSRKE